MPRPLRPQFPGAVYHVTARGIRGSPIFTSASERRRFLTLLQDTSAKLIWECFAYCLMTNHYHLVVATPDPNISIGMHRLNGAYARWFNRSHGHQGHLFQARFHSALVERDSHLLEACRYVVLNPVRAGLVQEASNWAWSSYRSTVDADGQPSFIASEALLELFGPDADSRRRRFENFVRDGQRSAGPFPPRPSAWHRDVALADAVGAREVVG